MTFGLSMIWSSFVIDSCALNTTRQNLPRAAHADAAGVARAFANVKARFHRWILASSFEYKNNLRSVMALANLILAIQNDITVGVRLQQW